MFLCIVAGVALGQFFPAPFQLLGGLEVARVNLPVGLLIWVMIIPMLLRIDFGALHEVRKHWRGIGVTLFINWAVKPFSMALLGWLFIRHLFAPYLPAEQIDSYIAGLMLLAAAPCTAMVFVWSRLVNGEPLFTLSQVALNDTIMVFAFAPLVALLLGLSAIVVPWDTLLVSVVLYIVTAGAAGAAMAQGAAGAWNGSAANAPWPRSALLIVGAAADAGAAVRLSGQGHRRAAADHRHARRADPHSGVFQLPAGLSGSTARLGEAHCVAGPSALIGASNFFELAVAAAISLFGFESGAALATVVGVLIEVPVMLLVVQVVNASKGWYERA